MVFHLVPLVSFQANVLIFAGGQSAREFVPVDAYWLPASLDVMGSLFLRVCGSGTSAYAVPIYFFIAITRCSGVINTASQCSRGSALQPYHLQPCIILNTWILTIEAILVLAACS